MKGRWKTCVGAFVIMFHPEQTCWASQREELIDLPDSNHNTSTFPLVCFLERYQDFINYFGWQIDLLLCPSAEESGTRDCEWRVCSSARARGRAYVNVCASAGTACIIVCVSSASSAIWPQSTGAAWCEGKCHRSERPRPSRDEWRQWGVEWGVCWGVGLPPHPPRSRGKDGLSPDRKLLPT